MFQGNNWVVYPISSSLPCLQRLQVITQDIFGVQTIFRTLSNESKLLGEDLSSRSPLSWKMLRHPPLPSEILRSSLEPSVICVLRMVGIIKTQTGTSLAFNIIPSRPIDFHLQCTLVAHIYNHHHSFCSLARLACRLPCRGFSNANSSIHASVFTYTLDYPEGLWVADIALHVTYSYGLFRKCHARGFTSVGLPRPNEDRVLWSFGK